MNTGVYSITFKTEEGDKIYIGSTLVSFHHREWVHRNQLKNGIHKNVYMQRLWNKHGRCDFLALEECNDPDLIHIREQWFIDQIDMPTRINNIPAGPSPFFQRHHTEETKEKIRKAHSNISLERRQKMSYCAANISEETRQKRSASLKGKHPTDEHRRKIGITKIGNTYCQGRNMSQQTREKISIANKQAWAKRKQNMPIQAEEI